MKLFKKLRKGFTLIELVVVIAVIAILAAVSVVSYVSITQKAKQSNDQQKIDQVNLSLQAAEISKKPSTMHEALEAVEADGFIVENFKAEANKYEFAYSLEENRFLILDGEKVVYPKDYTSLSKSPDIWRFSSSAGTLNDGFSHYLLESANGEVTTNAGVDVGKNSDISKVTYDGGAATQKVVMRTRGGDLDVTGTGTHLEHHGVSANVVVYSVSGETYVEHGCVGTLTLKEGAQKIILNSGSMVSEFTNENPDLVVENSGFIVSVESDAAGAVEESTGDIKVSNFEQLQSLAIAGGVNGFDFKDKVISIQKDIDMAGKDYVPFGYDVEHPFEGTILGNGHKISNMNSVVETSIYTTNTGTTGHPAGFIAYACGDVTIKRLVVQANLETTSNALSAFIGIYENNQKTGTVLFEDCKAQGRLVGVKKIGGFVGAGFHTGTVNTPLVYSFVRCTNEAVLVASDDRAGGFIGAYARKHNSDSITFTGCENKASVSAPKWYGSVIGYINDGNQKFLNAVTIDLTGVTNSYTGAPLNKVGDIHDNCLVAGHAITVVE